MEVRSLLKERKEHDHRRRQEAKDAIDDRDLSSCKRGDEGSGGGGEGSTWRKPGEKKKELGRMGAPSNRQGGKWGKTPKNSKIRREKAA